jgi:hypothetical protein
MADQPPWDAVAFPPIQFEAATPVVTSLPIPGVQRTGFVGIATCLTCGALVMTSSGEAIDLHHAWHAEQSRMDQPAASLLAPAAPEETP